MEKGRWTQKNCWRGKRKPEAEEGSALIFVICMMMVVAGLSLSLLLSAGTLLAMRRQIPAKEQCRIMADSISRLLNQELTKDEYEGIPEGIPEGESLWDYIGAYVCEENEAWPSYEEGKPGHGMDQARREFTLDVDHSSGWEKEAGGITIGLYWVNQTGEEWKPRESRETYFHEAELALHVEIMVSCQGLTCTRKDIYYKVSNPEYDSWKWSKWTERE